VRGSLRVETNTLKHNPSYEMGWCIIVLMRDTHDEMCHVVHAPIDAS